MAKRPWHRGNYHVRSRRITAAARADKSTRCWKCGRTMAQVQQTTPHAWWCAGHVNRAEVGGELRPECSPCSNSEGGRVSKRLRTGEFNRSRDW